MRNFTIAVAVASLLFAFGGSAFGQQQAGAANQSVTPTPLPKECQGNGESQASAGQMSASEMPKMDMSAMDEAHKDFMAGMMKMEPAMMKGMMNKDPDVAFTCGMIAHHQGAIDMANVELKYGDNAKFKEMARKIIKAQKQEITEFKEWLKANAK